METYIIARVKVLPYSQCPEMIYPLEIHGSTDSEEEAIKRAKKINGLYWKVNRF